MKRRIRENLWCPGLDRDVEHFVRDCLACAISDKLQVTLPSLVEAIEGPKEAWSKIAVDLIGPLTVRNGQVEYGIVLIDFYSCWPEFKLVKVPNSPTVIEFLESIFDREGIADEMLTVNGSQFTSTQFSNFLMHLDVKHIKTSLDHARSNGLVERLIRVIKENLQQAKAGGLNCKEELRKLLWAVRTTPNADTGVSLFVLLGGRVPATKLIRKWMGGVGVDEGLIEKVNEKRVLAQNKFKGEPRRTVCVKVGDYVKIKNARIIQKGESKFSSPKKVIKICKNAVKLEDGTLWNKERLSLACDVELLNKTGDESREVQETRDILRKNSPCDMKVLDKELKRSAKEEYLAKNMERKTSSRNRMLPSKYCDFVLFV
ncbi:hypothetical protein NDU88_008163 [Pleurodeles waltl]|uniref:Gypsy retrotransposon integrase-like protein 1 n=1 Tax=Pleurodeles waltl TaxID=8319 RepID=A0AAV7RX65_PLEWA|nr:hypothetical protein NDU88_008163 [Pleurodeles waltl]